MSPVAVVGAGGGTGLACVKYLLESNSELSVRAVVRDPAFYADSLGTLAATSAGRLQVVPGDVTYPDVAGSLAAALSGCGGVIYAASGKGYWSAEAVDYEGVRSVAELCKAESCTSGKPPRVVLVSSRLVTPANRWHPIRLLLNNLRWSLMDCKFRGELALRASGVPYTIIRPGGLTNRPAGQACLVVAQGDRGGAGSVARGDVAAVCVAALTDPAAEGVTLELTSQAFEAGQAVPLGEQLRGLFAGLRPDGAAGSGGV